MRYIAAKRLRFGDSFIEPGEDVPVEPGRNYRMMVRLGQVTEAREPDSDKDASAKAPARHRKPNASAKDKPAADGE